MRPQGASAPRLAFKHREIEELADVYFFRPLGMVLLDVGRPFGEVFRDRPDPRAAGALRLSPTQVTLVGTALILHGILDSSDGQLARMTGQVSELGRLLDGVSDYTTHVAIRVALRRRAEQNVPAL